MKTSFILSLLFISSMYSISEDKNVRGEKAMETITLGGGCFWCVEAIFEEVRGVLEVVSGYTGGELENPTYKQICTGETDHAEVCKITYDPNLISLEELLEIFFKTHNPTTLNRQGADVGTQYRSVIFYHNDDQKKRAQTVIDQLNRAEIWSKPIVTTLEPQAPFYAAEDYHQNYYARNPRQGYCRMVITPKLNQFRKVFEKYRVGKK
ncbi:MAG: peptide-methionine (S)-S-oxide reductase [Acidobacteria bacterium]|nr:MAG: peptide-methionine (S)-S-oxide reductase [Acidobacteriota bacterium]